jgi:hypothetical protein
MTLQQFITEIMIFCEKETQKIIAELQWNRFENDGQFNDNERWQGNSPKVIKDKGFDIPLQDTGHLRSELENPENWDLKPKATKTILTLTIPETEHFTESKYDVLQTGGNVDPYVSVRGNKINIQSVPARNFKNLSATDMKWIEDKLVQAIIRKFT